jgi:hypothetical protein
MTLSMSRLAWYVAIAAMGLTSRPATAQQPPALAGHYMACFTGADSTRPACGTLTLAPTTSCSPAGDATLTYDGYYSVLFSTLQLRDSTAPRPANELRFTWQSSPDGLVRFSRTIFVSDSLLRGETRCKLTNASEFEAWGKTAGDSVAGKWGTAFHWRGADSLGTFVLRPMPQ